MFFIKVRYFFFSVMFFQDVKFTLLWVFAAFLLFSAVVQGQWEKEANQQGFHCFARVRFQHVCIVKDPEVCKPFWHEDRKLREPICRGIKAYNVACTSYECLVSLFFAINKQPN